MSRGAIPRILRPNHDRSAHLSWSFLTKSKNVLPPVVVVGWVPVAWNPAPEEGKETKNGVVSPYVTWCVWASAHLRLWMGLPRARGERTHGVCPHLR